MDFDAFIKQGWADHGDRAETVARRLDDAIGLVVNEAQIPVLGHLAHHVFGEHLGDWAAGLGFLQRLGALPAFDAQGASGQAVGRASASLALSQGDEKALIGLGASDRIRAGAMAAANLAGRDAVRAQQLLHGALDEAERSELAADDPMNRALAANANSIACTLEERRPRSTDERALRILAAQSARRYWARTGTWLETERAEYRLAMTWREAGEPAEARAHAQACLAIVDANGGVPLESFFGWQALGLAARAGGDAAAHAAALAHAEAAFAALDESDKGWCTPELAMLTA